MSATSNGGGGGATTNGLSVTAAMILTILTSLGAAGLAALGGLADPTTARGDLIYRGDSGVTALAIGADASVLTSINGRPTWQTAAGGGASFSGTGLAIVASGDAGTLAASSTSAADLRTALGAQAATWTSVTASSFSLRDGTRGTVALTSGRLGFTVDGAALAYYDGTARTAARAYYAVPSTATDVAMVHRLYTRTSGSAQSYTGVTSLLRSGSDDTAAPSSVASYYANTPTNAIVLPGVARINDGGRNYYGDYNAAGAYGTGGTGGVAWPANTVVDDTWLGVRWREGALTYGVVVAPATSPPAVADFQWLSPPHTARWAGPPSLAVLTVTQVGGTPSAQAITAECVLYYR